MNTNRPSIVHTCQNINNFRNNMYQIFVCNHREKNIFKKCFFNFFFVFRQGNPTMTSQQLFNTKVIMFSLIKAITNEPNTENTKDNQKKREQQKRSQYQNSYKNQWQNSKYSQTAYFDKGQGDETNANESIMNEYYIEKKGDDY